MNTTPGSAYDSLALSKTSTDQLTTFQESAPIAAAAVVAPNNLTGLGNPYQDPALQTVLTRKYQIAALTWTTALGAGDPLTNSPIDLMKELMAVPNIREKLTQFRFIRTDVDVELRINATPFHLGALLVSYLPRCTSDGELFGSKMENLQQKSQNHGVVLSASTLNNVTLSFDREAPVLMDYIDTDASFYGALGQLDISVLNPLSLVSNTSVAPVTVSVFASFRNPQPSGFGYFPLTPAALRDRVFSTVVKQSLDTPARESHEKTSTNSLSAALGAVKNFAPLLKSLPLGSEVEPIVSTLAQFLPDLALSKPGNNSVVQPVEADYYRDLNTSHGMHNGTKFAFRQEAGLGDPTVNQLRKNKISDVVKRPMFVRSVAINGSTAVDTPILQTPVAPTLVGVSQSGEFYVPSHMAFMSQFFRFWRGSIKFMFKFITSSFVTARVRIAHWPSAEFPTSIEEYAGDVASAIVDIRGDTEYCVSVPYLSPLPYLPVLGYFNINQANQAIAQDGWQAFPAEYLTSFLTVSLINPLAQPEFGGPAILYMNVFVAAGDDFEYVGPKHPAILRPLWWPVAATEKQKENAVTQKGEIVRKQSLETAFAKPFKPIIPASATMERGLVVPEQVTTIEELTKWFRYYENLAETNDWWVEPNDVDPTGQLSQLFRWWRGSLRFKIMTGTDVFAGSVPARYVKLFVRDAVGDYTGFGVPPMSFAYWFDRYNRPSMSFEIPWNTNTYCASPLSGEVPLDDTTIPWTLECEVDETTPPAGFEIWRATGDDFMFGHLISVPNETFDPDPPLDKGIAKPKSSVDQTLLERFATRPRVLSSSPTV